MEPLILLFRPQWGLCISVYAASIGVFYDTIEEINVDSKAEYTA